MTHYVSSDQLIATNRSQGGDVRDRHGVEAAAARPRAGFGGFELYPDIWSKAGAFLHGLASTQSFADGNKRTAWIATLFFLRINDQDLRKLPRIAREAFVLAAATGLLSENQCAEWLKEHRLRSADRLDYAIFGTDIRLGEDATWSGDTLQLGGVAFAEFPCSFTVPLLIRIKWLPMDLGVTHTVSITVHTADDSAGETGKLDRGMGELVHQIPPPTRTGHPNHRHGIMPLIFLSHVPVEFLRSGRLRFAIELNGEPLASIPMGVDKMPSFS